MAKVQGATPVAGAAPTRRTCRSASRCRPQTSERWIADGDAVKSQLEDEGYTVDLQYAGDDIPTQSQQVDQMITQGVDALIIAAIDGTALSSQLQAAADAGIPVISYDRLIRDSENVDFYVSFDNFEVGVAQANALLTGLGVKNDDAPDGTATGPFNIELFAGSLDDNNAHFFFDGAMSVLQPLIDDGTLVVKSGQTDIEQVATLRWLQETAQKRMEDLLTGSYNDGTQGQRRPLALRRSVSAASSPRCRTPATARRSTPRKPMPIVTGQDAEIASVKLIADGVQSSTIFKDTRLLAEQAVIAAKAFLEGDEPEANDTETYDNGVKVVPVLPAAGRDGLQGRHPVGPDRLGLLDGRRGRFRSGRLTAAPDRPGPVASTPPGPAAPPRTTRTTSLHPGGPDGRPAAAIGASIPHGGP